MIISKGKDWHHEGILKIQVVSKDIDRKARRVLNWSVILLGEEVDVHDEFKDADAHAWRLYAEL